MSSKSGWGGKREGAGRKPRRLRAPILIEFEEAGRTRIEPLDVLESAMRLCYLAATKKNGEVDAELLDRAVQYASYAAPYRHQRLGSLDLRARTSGGMTITHAGSVVYEAVDNGRRRLYPPAPANDEAPARSGAAEAAPVAGGGEASLAAASA